MDRWFSGGTAGSSGDATDGAYYDDNKDDSHNDNSFQAPSGAMRQRQGDQFDLSGAATTDDLLTGGGNLALSATSNEALDIASMPLFTSTDNDTEAPMLPSRKRPRYGYFNEPTTSSGPPIIGQHQAFDATSPQAMATCQQSLPTNATSFQGAEQTNIMPGQNAQNLNDLNARSTAAPEQTYDFMSSFLLGTPQLPNMQAFSNIAIPGINQYTGGGGFGLPGRQWANMLGRPPGPNEWFPGMPLMMPQNPIELAPLQGNTLQQRLELPPTYNSTFSDSSPLAGAGSPNHGFAAPQGDPLEEVKSNSNPQIAAPVPNAHAARATAALLTRPIIIPPVDDGHIAHYSERDHVPLGIDEDPNWLSEFHCYVREELIEIFRASHQDVSARYTSKRVAYLQVGLRCRFCAHLPSGAKVSRSSAYPSSVKQIYQSIQMMVRDHFGQCSALPADVKTKFAKLKGKTSQGASDSKRYWSYSAMKRGMVDSEYGIIVNNRTIAAAQVEPPYGTTPGEGNTGSSSIMLVSPDDSNLVSRFLFTLMSQAYRVQLKPSERMGNRKSLRVGLPGFGCRYCCQAGRLGLCRMFPARRRTLYTKTRDLYDHLNRCALCPTDVKELLRQLEQQDQGTNSAEEEKEFFDRIWARLGHGSSHGGTSA